MAAPVIVDLPGTDTATVLRRLYELRESGGAVTLGRVLTLVVGVGSDWSAERAIAAANEASREHPCRVVVVADGGPAAEPGLDAQIRVGADAGASEVVLLRLSGALDAHRDAVVLPFLLPDTPVVTWWPGRGPDVPAEDPLGRIAVRRITGPTEDDPRSVLARRLAGYRPGDTDLAWSNITQWRGLLAASVETPAFGTIESASVSGAREDPASDLLAGWLAAALDVPVTRSTGPAVVRLDGGGQTVSIERTSDTEAMVRRTGEPDSRVVLPRRAARECLIEELRRLDPDEIYQEALRGLLQVRYETPDVRSGGRDEAEHR